MTRSVLMWLALTLVGGCAANQQAPTTAVEAAPAESAVVRTLDLQAPPNDGRRYRYLQLANGLQAVVVHDADTETAAATLGVSVGQFSDPETRQGLAHFLEHMLFLGTEKYPEIDDYRDFVQAHGGGTNASTSQEHTNYYFTIDQEFLEGGLDRFAQFFISPRIDPTYVDRERHAVESEYRLKIKEDARRIREVRRATSNPEHPFHKFSVGNLTTLEDRADEDLYAQLRALHDEHYRADRMVVGVIGRQSLDALEAMVAEKFAAVPGGGGEAPLATVPLFTPEQLGAQVNIVPLTEQRTMVLEWPVPPDREHWQARPIGFLTRLLGQEGPGSLHQNLRDAGLIERLSAYTSGTEDATLVRVEVGLTEDGLAQMDTVTERVFQYLRLIGEQGLDARYQTESKVLAETNYQFATEPSPLSGARVAARLFHLPPEHVVDSAIVWSDFDAELVKGYLELLTPARLRRQVIAQGLEADLTEPLYDVPYALTPLDPALLEGWASVALNPELALPEPNPYLPEDLTLVAASDKAVPELIVEEPGVSLWHLTDVEFGEPRATAGWTAYSPFPHQGLAQRQALAMYVAVITDQLNAELDRVGTAGMSLSMVGTRWGVSSTVRGYSDKLDEVAQLGRTALLEGEPDAATFARLQEVWVRSYENRKFGRPIGQSGSALSDLLTPESPSDEELAEVTRALTLADVVAAGKAWREGANFQGFTHGNLTADDARALIASWTEGLSTGEPMALPEQEVRRVTGEDDLVLRLALPHDDSTFIAYYQGKEDTFAEMARWSLLAQLLRTPFFTELRTERQLGYVVSARYDRRDRLGGLRLSIQSSATGPDALETEVDAFLERYRTTLSEMSDEDFDTVRDGLINALTEPPTSLFGRTNQLSSDLSLGYTSFDRRAQLAAELERLDKAGLLSFYEDNVLGEQVPRLEVVSIGEAHPDSEYEGCTEPSCVIEALDTVYTRPIGG